MLRMIVLNLLVWSAAAAAAAALARVSAEAPADRVPAAAAFAAPAAAEPPRWPRPEAFAAISERPLFSPSRRPPARAAVETAVAPAPALALVGVVGAPGARVALTLPQGRGDGATLRLRPGDAVSGWTVAEIDALSLTLSRGGALHVVKLGDRPDADDPAPGAAVDDAASAENLSPALRRLRAGRQQLDLEPPEYLGGYDD